MGEEPPAGALETGEPPEGPELDEDVAAVLIQRGFRRFAAGRLVRVRRLASPALRDPPPRPTPHPRPPWGSSRAMWTLRMGKLGE